SGSAHASKTSSGEASIRRGTVIRRAGAILVPAVGISISPFVRFEECLELVEAVAPEPLVVGGPARDAPDRLRIEGDTVLAAGPGAPHQPRALEHLHVLRDGVERHVEGLGEVGHARGALRQPLDDLSARRVRERRERAVENGGHIFNRWVEYSNWPALVKRSEVTPWPGAQSL